MSDIKAVTQHNSSAAHADRETREPIAIDINGEPVTFFYDLPGFISDQFRQATDAIAFWTRQHARDRAETADTNAAAGTLTGRSAVLANLGMERPDWSLDFAQFLSFEAAISEVLAETVAEVHSLAPSDRGLYLAQMVVRWFPSGEIDWARYSLAHMFSDYYETMPRQATALGAIDDDRIDPCQVLIGWQTEDGFYLDVVHQGVQHPAEIDNDVKQALAIGAATWGPTFAGVRYLPLGDMSFMRLYNTDGTSERASDFHTLLAAQQVPEVG